MGVYLPNVDMPKDDKVVTIQICPDGSIWQQYRGTVPNAKAVPVPPHGRLIAEDDAIKTAWMILEGLGYRKEENKQLEQKFLVAFLQLNDCLDEEQVHKKFPMKKLEVEK